MRAGPNLHTACWGGSGRGGIPQLLLVAQHRFLPPPRDMCVLVWMFELETDRKGEPASEKKRDEGRGREETRVSKRERESERADICVR